MLDRALKEAGVDRDKVYVTNAVKHSKFVPRGKIRLHQKPNTSEIKACRQWYERELASIKPDLVVAMGATAAQSVFGKITPINKSRGRLISLDDGTKALVTVHPSYLLRLPDEDARVREYERFVNDLKIVAVQMKKAARAAQVFPLLRLFRSDLGILDDFGPARAILGDKICQSFRRAALRDQALLVERRSNAGSASISLKTAL